MASRDFTDCPIMCRETVDDETPARLATSAIVGCSMAAPSAIDLWDRLQRNVQSANMRVKHPTKGTSRMAKRPSVIVVASTMVDMTCYVDRAPVAGETVV